MLPETAGQLDIAHRDTGGDRGEDARGMDFFGQQVGRERNQQVDQHRRTRLFAEAAPQPALEGGHAQGHRHAHGKAATATHTKVSEAVASEKVPVITAATAKRSRPGPRHR
jgi:hypothetical protein